MSRIFVGMLRLVGLIVGVAILTSCNRSESTEKPTFTVSILPLKYIVKSITGDDFDIKVMVPDGANPETYSPTPQQVIDIKNSDLVFITGLIDFETELVKRIAKTLNNNDIIDLSEDVVLITSSHSHADHHEVICNNTTLHHNHSEIDSSHNNISTHHGADPHIWTSPEQLKIVSRNAYNAIMAQYPDSAKYTTAYLKLIKELNSASAQIRARISDSNVKYFMIYHPAFTYYSRDYGVEQISLEYEGKEPSAVYMSKIAAKGRIDNVKYILYQRQFPKTVVQSLASDIDATPIMIDPLAEDIIGQILYITDIITEK